MVNNNSAQQTRTAVVTHEKTSALTQLTDATQQSIISAGSVTAESIFSSKIPGNISRFETNLRKEKYIGMSESY